MLILSLNRFGRMLVSSESREMFLGTENDLVIYLIRNNVRKSLEQTSFLSRKLIGNYCDFEVFCLTVSGYRAREFFNKKRKRKDSSTTDN